VHGVPNTQGQMIAAGTIVRGYVAELRRLYAPRKERSSSRSDLTPFFLVTFRFGSRASRRAKGISGDEGFSSFRETGLL